MFKTVSEELRGTVHAKDRTAAQAKFLRIAVSYFDVTADRLHIKCFGARVESESTTADGWTPEVTYAIDFGAVVREEVDE
jgi:hypothetical protein